MIQVCGINNNLQLTTESNSQTEDGSLSIVSPPKRAKIFVSKIISFSIYSNHAVWITNENRCFASGSNRGYRISNSIPALDAINCEEVTIKSSQGHPYKLLSAVCGDQYTLYMAEKIRKLKPNKFLLAYVYADENHCAPLIITMGKNQPAALYGGEENAAVIDANGAFQIINKSRFIAIESNSQNFILPDNEKAVFIACCNKIIIVLSSIGHVFTLSVDEKSIGQPEPCTELREINIINISGTSGHCFAVSDHGNVYVRGESWDGRLGIDSDLVNEAKTKFVKIDKFFNHHKHRPFFTAAYAGFDHSIFQCSSNQILACGNDNYGQFFHYFNGQYFSTPVEVPIKFNPTFIIAGKGLTCAFIDTEPQYFCPNQKIRADSMVSKVEFGPSEISNLRIENETLKQRIQDLELQLSNARQTIAIYQSQGPSSPPIHQEEISSSAGEESGHNDKHISDPSRKQEVDILSLSQVQKLRRGKNLGSGLLAHTTKVARDQVLALKVFRKHLLTSPKWSRYEEGHQSYHFSKSSSKSDSSENTGDSISYNLDKMKKVMSIYNQLNHPNIIKVIGCCYGDKHNPPSILVEYCPYTLKSIIKSLSNWEVIAIIFEITKAMKYAHQNGICHRDLRPENILLTSTKNVRISDFGVSVFMSLDMQKSAILETNKAELFFIAPELLSESHYNESVDVFSFGSLLYYMLTKGSYPASKDPSSGRMGPIPSSINHLSRKIIQSCWSLNPEQRPSFSDISALIVQNEFRLIDGVDVTNIVIRHLNTFHRDDMSPDDEN